VAVPRENTKSLRMSSWFVELNIWLNGGLPPGRRSALGGLLRALLCRFHSTFLPNEDINAALLCVLMGQSLQSLPAAIRR
jgi:hypothetical protein